MSAYVDLQVGQRIDLKGNELEICHIQGGNVRCANTKGGKMTVMQMGTISSLINSGQLTLLEPIENNIIYPGHLSDKQVEAMNRRLAYTRGVFDATNLPTVRKVAEPILKEIANDRDDPKPPGFSTFCRWYKDWIASNRDPMSLAPLHQKKGNRSLQFDPIVNLIINNQIEKSYLSSARPSAKTVHSLIIHDILEEYGEGLTLPSDIKLPSIRTINRRIAKIDGYKNSQVRRGKYQSKKDFKAAGISLSACRILEIVQADGHLLDVLIVDPKTGEIMGRPFGTCFFDLYSRCVISFEITMIPFSSATLLTAMKKAISGNNNRFGGTFESLLVDNGSDYISNSVRNFANHLGIIIEHGEPYNPNSKAHVERFFRTLNMQLIHNLPGTTFSNPGDRGEYTSEKRACITMDKLKEFIDQWLETIYHRTVHDGHGRAPEKLWQEDIKDNPSIVYPLEHLDTFAREVHIRNINKGRVTVAGLRWYSHALRTIEQRSIAKGRKPRVHVYVDELDLSRVFVEDPDRDGVFIQADSTTPDYTTNLSMYEHKIIRQRLKDKGVEDMQSYGENQLHLDRWRLWEDIVVAGDKYARKRRARIKETRNQHNTPIPDTRVPTVQASEPECQLELLAAPESCPEDDCLDFDDTYADTSYDNDDAYIIERMN